MAEKDKRSYKAISPDSGEVEEWTFKGWPEPVVRLRAIEVPKRQRKRLFIFRWGKVIGSWIGERYESLDIEYSDFDFRRFFAVLYLALSFGFLIYIFVERIVPKFSVLSSAHLAAAVTWWIIVGILVVIEVMILFFAFWEWDLKLLKIAGMGLLFGVVLGIAGFVPAMMAEFLVKKWNFKVVAAIFWSCFFSPILLVLGLFGIILFVVVMHFMAQTTDSSSE